LIVANDRLNTGYSASFFKLFIRPTEVGLLSGNQNRPILGKSSFTGNYCNNLGRLIFALRINQRKKHFTQKFYILNTFLTFYRKGE